jgi:dienelactone hydrolase
MSHAKTKLGCLIRAGACLGLAAIVSTAHAQAPRIEMHVIQTMTLTGTQFLTGAKDGKPAAIGGELRIPGGPGRFPAMVLVHGTNGIGPNVDNWAQELVGMGVAAFVIDSFTGRGIPNGAAMMAVTATVDAYRALEVLSKHPRIDPARIGIMGFSWGGEAALYSSLKRFHAMHASAGSVFAAHVPFYAGCFRTYIDDTSTSNRPVRLFHGSADDWIPVAPCRAYVERLRRAGNDVQLTEYPGAHHAFDATVLKAPVHSPRNRTPRACVLEEKPAGQMVNGKTGQPFNPADSCVEFGTTMAYDANAHAESLRAVKEFLRATFKLQ